MSDIKRDILGRMYCGRGGAGSMTDDEMQELIRHGWTPPPRDELLREALSALTFVVETRDCNHLTASDTFRDYYAQSCPICRCRAVIAKAEGKA